MAAEDQARQAQERLNQMEEFRRKEQEMATKLAKQAQKLLKQMEEFHQKEQQMQTKFAELESENQVLKQGKYSSHMAPATNPVFQANPGVMEREKGIRDEDGVSSKMASGTTSTEKDSNQQLKRRRAAILKPVAI